VVEISGGEHHTLFLLDNGEVWACGRCDGAQLGLGETHPAMVELKERADEAREKVTAETGMGAAGTGTNAPAVDEFIPEPVQVSVSVFLCSLVSSRLPSIDADRSPPLVSLLRRLQIYFPPAPTADDPAPEFAPYPSSSEEYTPQPMVSISAGTRHNLAVSRDGNVYAWGYGSESRRAIVITSLPLLALPSLLSSIQKLIPSFSHRFGYFQTNASLDSDQTPRLLPSLLESEAR
jgi:regulator of chromosome condensation